uniref:Uncharacterized protein n=1 Tax=Rhizophora mucronata TaxID=61149 RepID=A0A2P2NZK6_RHIMU
MVNHDGQEQIIEENPNNVRVQVSLEIISLKM